MVIQLEVRSLTRNAGSKTITEAIHLVDPEAEVETHPESRQVTVKTKVPESSVMEVLDRAGYRASLAQPFLYDL